MTDIPNCRLAEELKYREGQATDQSAIRDCEPKPGHLNTRRRSPIE